MSSQLSTVKRYFTGCSLLPDNIIFVNWFVLSGLYDAIVKNVDLCRTKIAVWHVYIAVFIHGWVNACYVYNFSL